MKNTLIGVGIGFGLGCACAAVRTVVTLTCPVLWIPGAACSLGCLAHLVSEGNPYLTAAGLAVGAAVGTAELVAYPITAPLSLVGAAAMPVCGAVAGGLIGHSK